MEESCKVNKTKELLRKARVYVQSAHDDAKRKHDSYDNFCETYMDSGLYEIMQETEQLLSSIDDNLNNN